MYKPRYRYSIITPDTAVIGNGYYASIYEVTLREVEVTEITTTTTSQTPTTSTTVTTITITENLGQITTKAETKKTTTTTLKPETTPIT